jgi:hypothetical protein
MQMVELIGRVISPSQGRYLHAGQHKLRINVHTDIHALSVIRTHDPSFRASEDSLYALDCAATVIGNCLYFLVLLLLLLQFLNLNFFHMTAANGVKIMCFRFVSVLSL